MSAASAAVPEEACAAARATLRSKVRRASRLHKCVSTLTALLKKKRAAPLGGSGGGEREPSSSSKPSDSWPFAAASLRSRSSAALSVMAAAVRFRDASSSTSAAAIASVAGRSGGVQTGELRRPHHRAYPGPRVKQQ